MINRLLGRRLIVVPCTVSIEHTHLSLEAHVELEGVDVESGDEVRVHDAPTDVAFGDSLVCERTATVMRGGWFDHLWARIAGMADFTELYDLSFTGRRQL